MILTQSCQLRAPGNPGVPAFSVDVAYGDDAILPPGSATGLAWRTDAGPSFATIREEATGFIEVFDDPPGAALEVYGDVGRLDFFRGTFDDLERVAKGEPPDERVARSRSSLWWVHDPDRVAVAPVAEAAFNFDGHPVALLVDSGDPDARRCGDNVVADALPACADCRFDEHALADEDPCCASLRAAFDACRAVVASQTGEQQELPALVRVLP